MDWGGGLVWIAGPATEAGARGRGHAGGAGGRRHLDADARARGRCAPPSTVIPAEPAPLARITRAVKAAFDPKGILNPGRMYAGV